jgi:hypothetical protein
MRDYDFWKTANPYEAATCQNCGAFMSEVYPADGDPYRECQECATENEREEQ